jgi:hypothetical protein
VGIPRKAARDREIFAAFLKGASIEALSAEYYLTPIRVDAILRAERHKIAVSPEPEYRQLRHPG